MVFVNLTIMDIGTFTLIVHSNICKHADYIVIIKKGGQAMSLLIGGAVSVIIGLLGLIFWWSDFLIILKGGLPIVFVFGGILAVYVGLDEIQEKLREETQKQEESLAKAKEEIEIVRAQAVQYKEELEKIKEETKKQE